MAALVESLFYVGRNVPWHGLGVSVETAPTSGDALVYAGLDWEVEQREIMDSVSRKVIPGFYANTRTSDNSVLGVVGSRYKIVQNTEAFEFTDSLLNEGVTYETAGSLKDGRTIWLLVKMPTEKILGDDVDPYICFTNSHDGSGCIKVCMTPTRVVCNNTLNLALSNASRMWSTRHVGDIQGKLEEAKLTLGLATDYMKELANEADILANTTISSSKLNNVIELMFPISTADSKRKAERIEEDRAKFMKVYNAPDIKKFQGTAWGVVNAAADFADHYSMIRNTANGAENRWASIMSGHPLLDNAYKLAA